MKKAFYIVFFFTLLFLVGITFLPPVYLEYSFIAFTILVFISPFIFIIVWLIAEFINSIKYHSDQFKESIDRKHIDYSEKSELPVLMSETEIHDIDKDLDVDKFMKNVYKIYCSYQNAIQNYDYDVLESILGHDLKILKIEQVQELEKKGVQKVTNKIANLGGGIYHIYKYGPIEKIDVLLNVHRSTYMIDKKSKNILFGYRDEIERVTYHLTFESTLNGLPSNCPNCGAEINVDKNSKCKYCNNTIENVHGDYNLIYKEILRIEPVKR